MANENVTVVIIGGGPSAMFLSYILDGNIPYYDPSTVHGPHPDPTLHELLLDYTYNGANDLDHRSGLLGAVKDLQILQYIETSYTSFYSSEMLPINLLFDTLVASDETQYMNLESKQTRIFWQNCHDRGRINHVVLNSSPIAGGQWASTKTTDKPCEQSLSFAEMLSISNYSYTEYYRSQHDGKAPPDFDRPCRSDLTGYYAAYPHHVNIHHNFINESLVVCVDKDKRDSFITTYIRNYNSDKKEICTLTSKHLVLASGIYDKPTERHNGQQHRNNTTFDELVGQLTTKNKINLNANSFNIIPPLSTPPSEGEATVKSARTILVIGSGVSAAEAVNDKMESKQHHNDHHILHIYKWDKRPSSCPLRRYTKDLYPEYHRVFQLMRVGKSSDCKLGNTYIGLPNATVLDVEPDGTVEIRLHDGQVIRKRVNEIIVRTGRSGSLDYLSRSIVPQCQIDELSNVTKHTLRGNKLPPNVYAIGSLTGDTLVRFLFGGCLSVASDLYK